MANWRSSAPLAAASPRRAGRPYLWAAGAGLTTGLQEINQDGKISIAVETSCRKPQTANRKPQTANRKPQTANRKPQTANRKPQTANRKCITTGEDHADPVWTRGPQVAT